MKLANCTFSDLCSMCLQLRFLYSESWLDRLAKFLIGRFVLYTLTELTLQNLDQNKALSLGYSHKITLGTKLPVTGRQRAKTLGTCFPSLAVRRGNHFLGEETLSSSVQPIKIVNIVYFTDSSSLSKEMFGFATSVITITRGEMLRDVCAPSLASARLPETIPLQALRTKLI